MGSYLVGLRAYSLLFALVFLARLEEPYMLPGMEPKLIICKAHALLVVLSLQPINVNALRGLPAISANLIQKKNTIFYSGQKTYGPSNLKENTLFQRYLSPDNPEMESRTKASSLAELQECHRWCSIGYENIGQRGG